MRTAEQWIDETPGTIEDEEHRADLIKLYKRIQRESLLEAAEIVMHAMYSPVIRDAILTRAKEVEAQPHSTDDKKINPL